MSKTLQRYHELLSEYGHPRQLWPQWCGVNKDEYTRQVVALGAILTQRTSWTNAEKALVSLKNAGMLSLENIAAVNLERLTELVRVAGFYTTKPKRLQVLCQFVLDRYGSLTTMRDVGQAVLREELLGLYGIGPETADTLLLYALDKPSFVIDAYTNRFVQKYSLASLQSYDELKDLFESTLPIDVEVYQNYHILIIADQKGGEKCGMSVV